MANVVQYFGQKIIKQLLNNIHINYLFSTNFEVILILEFIFLSFIRRET